MALFALLLAGAAWADPPLAKGAIPVATSRAAPETATARSVSQPTPSAAETGADRRRTRASEQARIERLDPLRFLERYGDVEIRARRP